MRLLTIEKQVEICAHLVEGCGVRATARLCEVDKNTVQSLLLRVGRGCLRIHDRIVRGLALGRIECDELVTTLHTRAKNLRDDDPPEWGALWTYTGFATVSKLLVSFCHGKRTQATTDAFIADMRARLITIPVFSTDAFQGYPKAVGAVFDNIDYAQVVKAFGSGKRGRKKVDAPAMTKRTIWGAPDLAECGTSRGERLNLSFRTQLRRLVRKGSGFSKSVDHHRASISMYAGFFNFCRIHMALRVTPAMQAGITDHVWSPEEFVEACLSEPEGEAPSPRPLDPRPGAQGAARQTPTGAWLRAVPKPGSAPAAPIMTPRARQGDLFEWAKSRPAKPLPPKGTQLKLFED